MWSYNTSRDEKKRYFPSYDDTQFAILCGMRYSAVTNNVPDYYVYDEEGKLFETVYGDDLFKIYVENGGYVFEDCINKDNKEEIKKENEEVTDLNDFYETISSLNHSLENLVNNINKLTNIVGGDKNER